jgi:putative MFS transporter
MASGSLKWIDPLVDRCGFGRYQILLLIQTGATNFASASMFVILGSMVTHLPLRSWGVTGVEAGLLQSAIFVGVTLGTLIGGVFADRFGRRSAVMVSYAFLLVAGSMLVIAQGYRVMVAACILFGAVTGFALPAMNSLLVESSPVGRRGELICLSSLLWFAGELYGAGVVWFVGAIPGVAPTLFNWRACFLLGFLPAAPVVIYAWFSLQESPRFLANRGRLAELDNCLTIMAAMNRVPDPQTSQDAEIPPGTPQSCDKEPPPSVSLEKSLLVLTRWPINVSTAGLMVVCLVCNFAYFGLIFALPQILRDQMGALQMVGGASVQVFVVTLFKVPGICVAYLLLRTPQVGHKTSLASLLLATSCTAWAFPEMMDIGFISGAFVSACGLKLSISAAFIITYVFVLEVYPTQVRSTGMALCTMVGRIGSIMSPLVHSYASEHSGHNAYFFCIALCTLLAAGTAMFIPMDTKGRPLGEGEDSETSRLLDPLKK